MTVYDDQKLRDAATSDDDLRRITGISPDEESAMEDRAGSTSDDNQEDSNTHSPKSWTDDMLKRGEEKTAELEALAKGGPEKNESDTIINFQFTGGKGGSKKKRNRALMAAGGGGGALVICFMLLFLLASQNKVVSFGHILSAAGYARFNGIIKERTTQDLFDAAVVEGDGTASLTGRSLLDRFSGRNLDADLAELGREGEFKLKGVGENFEGVQLGDQTILTNDVANDLYGKDYASLKVREKFTVRNEMVGRVEIGIEQLGLESKYLRGQLFDTIANNTGFSFGRWAQAARKYFGTDPIEANKRNRLENEGIVNEGEPIKTGVDDIDDGTEKTRDPETLEKFLDDNGGDFDSEAFKAAATKDVGQETATRIAGTLQEASNFALVASVVCMAHEAFDKIPEIYNQNVMDARRQGLQLLAARDQTKEGAVYSEAVDAVNHQLDGGENSPYYEQAVGLPVTKGATVPRIRPKVSPTLNKIIDYVSNPLTLLPGGGVYVPPGIRDKVGDKFCDTLLSTEGAIALGVAGVVGEFVVGVLTAGIGDAAAEGGAFAVTKIILKEMFSAVTDTVGGIVGPKGLATLGLFVAYSYGLQMVVGFLAGANISGAASGDEYVTTSALGMGLEQNVQMQTIGGMPISSDDAKQIDQDAILAQRKFQTSKGVFNRYLAIDNPYSLLNLAITKTPTTFTSFLGGLKGFMSKIGSIFQLKTFLSLPFLSGNKAYADTTDFDPYQGLTQIGFSSSELKKMRTDESYSMIENAARLSDESIKEYDEKYGKCFDPTVTPWDLLQLQETGDKPCSADSLGQDNVFRYRLYRLDNALADTIKTPPNVTNGSSGTTGSVDASQFFADSTNVPCAAGTEANPAIQDGYTKGNLVKVHICIVDGSKVNARISGQIDQLVRDANAAGVKITPGSGFRTMKEQTDLYNQNPGKAAKPGTSNHQMGLAVDFGLNGQAFCYSSGHQISNYSPDKPHTCPGNAGWEWMKANASKYGLKAFYGEAWHWSVSGG